MFSFVFSNAHKNSALKHNNIQQLTFLRVQASFVILDFKNNAVDDE